MIDQAIDTAITKYSGQLVADQQGGYIGECLSLVKKIWGDILGVQMPGAVDGYAWGDGYYLYFDQSLPLPTYFNKVVYQSGVDYPKGSMVIYAPTHHIAIWLKDNGNGTHTVFEQNADPDGAPAHIGTRANTRITGVLTPKGANVSSTRKAIPPETVRENIINYTNGLVQVNATDAVCQNRFEDIVSDEFWYGMVPMLHDIITGLQKQLAASPNGTPTVLTPGNYLVK